MLLMASITVEQSSSEGISAKPEWLRLPAPKHRCPHTGLSRSTLCELVAPSAANNFNPPVQSVVLRKRGATRGIRLVRYDSLMTYLRALSEGDNAGAN